MRHPRDSPAPRHGFRSVIGRYTTPPCYYVDILIIEDEATTRAVLAQMLGGRSHRIVQCTSAEQAIELYRQNFFPLVVLDLGLPGMSGFEFCRWLRRQPDGDRPFILVGTASQEASDLREILEAGADDYLAKPYLADLLNVRLAIAERNLTVRAGHRNLEEELRQERERLTYLASRDSLTKLFNRAHFASAVETAVAAAQDGGPSGSLLYIDLDHFGLINNAAGHPAGDRLLVQLAYLLGNSVRPDDLVARFGDDSFAVLQQNITAAEARLTAERIRTHVNDLRFSDTGRHFGVTVSSGVAALTGESSAEQVMSAADAACYAAKARGRNRVEVYQANPREIACLREDARWAAQIRAGLKDNAFVPWFQPVVNLETCRVVSHELLTRLQTSDGQLAEPALFLPAAERFHLTGEIDRRMIKLALRRLAAEPGLRLSLALCGQTLAEAELGDFISGAFTAAGVAPERLVFEIGATSTNLDAARTMLEHAGEKALHFALAGLGAGAWSCAGLQRLSLDYLKIPGDAIRGLVTDPIDRAYVKVMHDTARHLGINSVAEHVDAANTLKALRGLGVLQGQGSYFGRPAPEPQW
jgi:diguanylate cyclase (GGDEF)-like protein